MQDRYDIFIRNLYKVPEELSHRIKFSGHLQTDDGVRLTRDCTSRPGRRHSDGTNELRVLDPVTFAEKRRIKVTAAGAPIRALNEIEYVKGEILANIWQTDYVARIAPATGKVSGYIDFRGLLSPQERLAVEANGGVLNGIAYDAARDRLFITGKLWPKLFEVTFVPAG